MTPDLRGYDHIIVALSGGKDSVASLLAALELEARPESIELWHHDVDGGGEGFMDWPSTPGYVRQIARAFNLPCYMSWRYAGRTASSVAGPCSSPGDARKKAPAVPATACSSRIVPALPYRIGFGRLSCLGCIFMSADQAATFRLIAPARFAAYERAFGCTIRRDIDLNTLADRGGPFPAALQQPDLVRQALSPDWAGSVLTGHWRLPAGAFGESAGPG
mgnify:FL=1